MWIFLKTFCSAFTVNYLGKFVKLPFKKTLLMTLCVCPKHLPTLSIQWIGEINVDLHNFVIKRWNHLCLPPLPPHTHILCISSTLCSWSPPSHTRMHVHTHTHTHTHTHMYTHTHYHVHIHTQSCTHKHTCTHTNTHTHTRTHACTHNTHMHTCFIPTWIYCLLYPPQVFSQQI